MSVFTFSEPFVTGIFEDENVFSLTDSDTDSPSLIKRVNSDTVLSNQLVERIHAGYEKKEAVLSSWQWFPAFPVARSLEDGSIFVLRSMQKEYEFRLSMISNVIDFVRKKGEIQGLSFSMTSKEYLRPFIHLSYLILENDRNKLGLGGRCVKIAQIELPYEACQHVKVMITPLATINDSVKSKWSLDTYCKMNDFVIYYINQLYIDEVKNKTLTDITNQRLSLACKAAKANAVDHEISQYLFENY